MFEVRFKMLVDLLTNVICEDARGLDDLPILRQNLFNCPALCIINSVQVFFRGVSAYAQFASYFLVGTIEFVQIDDSTYICHRFHLWAHLSAYLEREAFLLEGGGQKRTGVSLNSGVKIESAKTHYILLERQSLNLSIW
jgi:hypothetical protein